MSNETRGDGLEPDLPDTQIVGGSIPPPRTRQPPTSFGLPRRSSGGAGQAYFSPTATTWQLLRSSAWNRQTAPPQKRWSPADVRVRPPPRAPN